MSEQVDRTVFLVSQAVSDALETPIEDLPPLSESIDLDGLDAVVSRTDVADVTVTFSYAGLRVFVHSEGIVYVRTAAEDGEGERGAPFLLST